MSEFTGVEEQVEYGLEKVDSSRTVSVNLRDFIYLLNTLQEFVRFFHQPMHWETWEEVDAFIGNKDRGAFHLLCECVYEKFYYTDVLPKDIVEMIDKSDFENPVSPYYYEPKSDG